ncbi:MAG: PTS IIA-like nitrogen regulatory protein PtsN [Gammaproteobacteria bacterium]|jgi:PTS system nitrogen regulatory IIA component|nr:PTS IIA-like nitrogen regulatory protein PtsN [Gammaproteobacteria bacterium]MDH5171801.1 PTS IIA-like nitrogen regulatory protein PtsN [Gammaproteobacteria bacterium]
MNFLTDILSPGRTVCHAPGASKKRLFETIARIISEDQPSLVYEAVLSQLIAREKLGSTGLGQGIAIPHCRVDACPQPLGTLVTLEQPIDFDAPDDQPVDLLFALLVPGEAHQQHLDILANVARLFSQAAFCRQLRNAQDSRGLFDLATGHMG